MTRHRLGLLPLAALLAAPVTAQSTRYTLKGDSVAVYNLVGELRVEPASGSDVTVELTRGGADAARLEVQTGPLRGRETLRVIYPDDLISLPEWGRGWNTTLRVRDDGTFGEEYGRHERAGWFREGREVRITGRGRGMEAADVAADRTRGTLKIATGSGNVDLRDAAGDVALETGSGDITAANMRGTRLRLETGSGNVTLTGAQAPDLHVETGSGDVTVSGAQGDDLSFETGSGNVDVELRATFQSLRIETGSGDVTLKVPPSMSAQVDLDTGSGDIDLGGLTIQVRRLEQDHITGTIGDGRGRLSIETGSGNVRLVKL